ncbi:MAG: HAD family hydrolase, partial [Ruminococcus sp.]|nr:HAD family hydrolase [Ruminococcus sp.]
INEFHLSLSKPQVISRIEEMVREEYEQHIPLKPYAAEMAQYLSENGIPCGVATATYKNLAQAVLRRCGIDGLFRFILTDAEYPMGKRFPDIFLGGAEVLGSAPGETLVIEDSLHCIETAAAAGFLTAGVYDDASAGDAEAIRRLADYYFNDLSDLKRLV